jgi:hypothetical protein
MYLEKKLLFLMVGGIVVLLVVLGFVLYFFKYRVTPSNPVVENTGAPIGEDINNNQPAPVGSGAPKLEPQTTIKTEPTETYFKQLAQMFVERYGSYSNQNNNSHITDVIPLVTKNMAKWIQTQEVTPSSEYSGVTTRVVAVRVLESSASKVVVAFDAQKEVSRVGEESKREYQSGKVNLEKVAEEWKVSGIYWDK